jgi:predicted aspartyl protease
MTRQGRVAASVVLAVLVGGCVTAHRTADAPAQPPRVILEAATRVPIRIVQNITLVQATLNDIHRVTLIVDTGAQSTILAPAVVKRLGVMVSTDGPRRQVSVVGGGKLDIPFVKLGTLRVGDARVEGMEVGVFDAAPTAHGVHGLLGADFLHQFRFTLDGVERWLRLEPLRRDATCGRTPCRPPMRLEIARGG